MVRHTDDEIERAAHRFERLADELDPATTAVEHTDDLRQVTTASEAARADEARLQEAVQVARAHGRSSLAGDRPEGPPEGQPADRRHHPR